MRRVPGRRVGLGRPVRTPRELRRRAAVGPRFTHGADHDLGLPWIGPRGSAREVLRDPRGDVDDRALPQHPDRPDVPTLDATAPTRERQQASRICAVLFTEGHLERDPLGGVSLRPRRLRGAVAAPDRVRVVLCQLPRLGRSHLTGTHQESGDGPRSARVLGQSLGQGPGARVEGLHHAVGVIRDQVLVPARVGELADLVGGGMDAKRGSSPRRPRLATMRASPLGATRTELTPLRPARPVRPLRWV